MAAADSKSVGIIGAGRIGRAMARIARRAGRRYLTETDMPLTHSAMRWWSATPTGVRDGRAEGCRA